jgi:hypothetical protein
LTPLALGIGQIVRAPDFEYIDALGALEIMDPKTDSGMILDDDHIEDSPKVEGLLPEEILWIMDQLLAREVEQKQCHSEADERYLGIMEIRWRRQCILALTSRHVSRIIVGRWTRRCFYALYRLWNRRLSKI